MKILLISYGYLEYDGRLRSLISVFDRIGEVYTFTRGNKLLTRNGTLCNSSYLSFICSAVIYAKKLGKIDLLVLDNRKATIPGLLIKWVFNPVHVVQDCRELYLISEAHNFTKKIGCVFERFMVRKADIVICANLERSKIMKQEYGLTDFPLVYENIRILQYSSEEKKEKARKKFAPLIKDDEIRIISSSGCSVSRTNDILVKNLKNVRKKCRLFLVGDSTEKDVKIIKDLAKLDTKNEVVILGRLNQTELKYLITQCHIGIVNYGQYDTNNKFCASGKLYEFLYEGLPVVTTMNPPLKRLCEEYGIGRADSNYAVAINDIINDYDVFKSNVLKFVTSNTVKSNDEKFLLKLLEKIKEYNL